MRWPSRRVPVSDFKQELSTGLALVEQNVRFAELARCSDRRSRHRMGDMVVANDGIAPSVQSRIGAKIEAAMENKAPIFAAA